MNNKEASKISFVKNKDMEGVQVKLNNAYRWKVTICEEVPERGAVGLARPNRKRAATEYGKKVFHAVGRVSGRSCANGRKDGKGHGVWVAPQTRSDQPSVDISTVSDLATLHRPLPLV